MKELQEFNNWATTIVESSIFEAPKKDGPIKREIPQTQDIVYQAKRRYPDRDTDQALSLFLADKLEDFDRRDLEQNAVINAQRRENAKLNTNLTKLQQELDTIETNSEQTDVEIQRLKTLSGKMSADAQQRQISMRELDRALAQVEELKNKPGLSNEEYEELKKEVNTAKQNIEKVNPEEFKKFSNQLNALQSEQTIERNQLERLNSVANLLQTEKSNIETQRTDLEQRISDLETKEKNINQEIKKAVDDSVEKLKTKQSKYRKAVRARSKQANTLIKNFLDKQYPEIKQKLDKINTDKIDNLSSIVRNQTYGNKNLHDEMEKLENLHDEMENLKKYLDKFLANANALTTTPSSADKKSDFEKSKDTVAAAIAAAIAAEKAAAEKAAAEKAAAEKAAAEKPEEKPEEISANAQATSADLFKRMRDPDRMKAQTTKQPTATLQEDLFGNGSVRTSLTDRDIKELSMLLMGFNNPRLDPKMKIKLLYLKQSLSDDKFLGFLLELAKSTFSKGVDDDEFFSSPNVLRVAQGVRTIGFFIEALADEYGLQNILAGVDKTKMELYSEVFKKFPKLHWMDPPDEFIRDFSNKLEEIDGLYSRPRYDISPEEINAIDLTKSKSNLEESINKMVDNIIGEDVARWIK